MLRRSLFLFIVSLLVVIGSLYQDRRAPVEKLMLIQDNASAQNRLMLLDPPSGRDFTLLVMDTSLSFMTERGDWFYFAGKEGTTPPLNIPKFYRIHRHTELRQVIYDDAYSQLLTQILWEQEKVFYVRRNGTLAVVNLDGTANHDLELPANLNVLQDSSATFTLTQDEQALIFAVPQGENADFMRLSLKDGRLENLTANLDTPHQCLKIHFYETVIIVKCDDIFYYARPPYDRFYHLFPGVANPDLQISNNFRDETVLYIYDQMSPLRYEIDLTDEHDPLTYREIDLSNIARTSGFVLLEGSDWKITRRYVEDHNEVWLNYADGTEKLLFNEHERLSPYPLTNGHYLISVLDIASYKTTIYSLTPDGRHFAHIYETEDFVQYISRSPNGNTIYFLQAPDYYSQVYQLQEIDQQGQVKTVSDWPRANILIKWYDNFELAWSPRKLGLVGLLGLSIGVSLVIRKRQQYRAI